jgi:hypothetical protein
MSPLARQSGPLRGLALAGTLSLAPFGSGVGGATCQETGMLGPLRVSERNPRYFTNDCGRAVYLTGSHTWNNFPDMDDQYPPENEPFGFGAYLDFLESYGHNFIRLWAWETPFPDDANSFPRRVWASPQPWFRTGPGEDVTGLPRFDLSSWAQPYFDRLRARVEAAAARGIYVSIMLFEGWELQFAPGRPSHPFNGENNVAGVHFGARVTDIHTLVVPEITAIQEDYVRRVIDAVNDFDNVLYEVCNECGSYSVDWQLHMLEVVRQYESAKPKRHPVGMTFIIGVDDQALLDGPADWISPSGGLYRTDPPPNDGTKVILIDNDHLLGSEFGDPDWVWRSFTRGLNPIFMDQYDPPDSIATAPLPNADEIRRAMGQTLRFSRRMDLLAASPAPSLSSTSYALAGPDDYLIYAPSGGSFSVNLSASPGSFLVEWLDPATDTVFGEGAVSGGATRTFLAPFPGTAVLYLYRDPRDPPQPSSLRAAYGFEEGSGPLVVDRSGNGNSGTISGAIRTSGRFGDGLQFDGSGAVVTVAGSPSLDLTSGMTLEAWVYPEAAASDWMDVVYREPDAYYLEGSSPLGGAPATGGTFSATPLFDYGTLSVGTWSHLAATYDGATLRLYRDGVEVASRPQSGSIHVSTGDLTIGGDALFGQFWAGKIDEVRIHDRPLLPAEIEREMHTPVAPPGVGEAALLRAGKNGPEIGLSFVPACAAGDHAVFWGVSPIVGSVEWSDAACGFGVSGSALFDPGTPPPGRFLYWVVVGQSASFEGSYGRDSLALERPEAIGTAACDFPREIVDICP